MRQLWSPPEDALLRRLPPVEVARRRAWRTVGAVYARRFCRGWTARRPHGGNTTATPPHCLFHGLCPAALIQVLLAVRRQGALKTSHVLARGTGVPCKHLFQLLPVLTRAGFVESWGGPFGGYRLARPADSVTLLEVAEAVDGPTRHDVPAVDTDSTLDCRLQAACDASAETVRESLGRVRVAELARRPKGGRS
jgi:Rrf2 family protein